MNKKFIALVSSVVMMGGVMAAAGCGKKDDGVDLRIAYLTGGRGDTYVEKLVEGFKQTDASLKDIEVEIVKSGGSAIEDDVESSIKAGKVPDVLFLNFNMDKKLSNKFVSAKQLVDLSDLLTQKVYNEETTLADKLIPGVLENYTTKPYGDKVYSLPAFYSPTGLWYDASRFGEGKEYTLPTTWDEFFALGDKLNEAIAANGGKVDSSHPALFTYPTAGYFDGYIYSAIAGVAGEEKFMKVLGYTDGIWEDADVKNALEKVVKLRDYLEPTTVANASSEGYKSNQQAVIGDAKNLNKKGTALFLPNGDWLPGEMIASTPEGFEWGFMALPKKDVSSKSYVNTFIENVYLHKEGKNLDLAKKFLLYYFSNEGAKVVAKEANAIIPTKDALANAKANGIADATIKLYDVYEGNVAVSGSFISTQPVTGLIWTDVLFNDLTDKVFNKDVKGTNEEILNAWCGRLESASDQYREKILK